MNEYFEHVSEVVPQDDCKVVVRFTDGSRGVFDCTPYANDPYWACLKDEAVFRQVGLDHGVLTWPNGVDIAPEEVWQDAKRESSSKNENLMKRIVLICFAMATSFLAEAKSGYNGVVYSPYTLISRDRFVSAVSNEESVAALREWCIDVRDSLMEERDQWHSNNDVSRTITERFLGFIATTNRDDVDAALANENIYRRLSGFQYSDGPVGTRGISSIRYAKSGRTFTVDRLYNRLKELRALEDSPIELNHHPEKFAKAKEEYLKAVEEYNDFEMEKFFCFKRLMSIYAPCIKKPRLIRSKEDLRFSSLSTPPTLYKDDILPAGSYQRFQARPSRVVLSEKVMELRAKAHPLPERLQRHQMRINAAKKVVIDDVEWRYEITNGYAQIIRAIPTHWSVTTNKSGIVTVPSVLDGINVRAIAGSSTFGGYRGWPTSVIISDGISSIGRCAFLGCEQLNSVAIPDSVTNIGELAFHRCYGLKSVSIPSSVAIVQDRTFEDCCGIAEVKISDGVQSIGKGAFKNCAKLTTVSIPDSVSYIGSHAFAGCYNLDSAKLSENISNISPMTFHNCAKLKSVIIPESVTNIGFQSFSCCKELSTVKICDGVSTIGENAFAHCPTLTSVTIPKCMTNIYRITSSKNSRKLTAGTIPSSLSNVCMNVFFDCANLKAFNVVQEGKIEIVPFDGSKNTRR